MSHLYFLGVSSLQVKPFSQGGRESPKSADSFLLANPILLSVGIRSCAGLHLIPLVSPAKKVDF